MSVSAITNISTTQPQPKTNRKRPFFNPVSVTGYAATACGIGSVAAIKNKSGKWHKNLAYAMGALVLAHVGLLEWYHHKKG